MRVPEAMRRAILEVGYRLGGWPRRAAALLCLGLALLTAVTNRPRPTTPAAPVVIATRDLAAGTVLHAGDIALSRWPPTQIPPRAYRSVRQAVGVVTAAAMDRGEPLTSARIRGPGITAGLAAGLVAATVALSSSNTLALIRPGDRVDLLAATPADVGASASSAKASASARVVASGVRVLAVLASPPQAGGDGSAGLVVAVDRTTALALAAVVDGSMTATLRMPP